jgi:signal transduction histidine kinase/CheY-like chemotaxis protein
LVPDARLAIVGSASNRAPSLRWYLSVGFLLVGVAPLLFFGAQRVSALSGAQDDSVHQTHERLAATLAQAIYGFVLDQTATLQSTVNQIEDDDRAIHAWNQPGFDPSSVNLVLAATHKAQVPLLQLYVGNLEGRAVAADPPSLIGADYHDRPYIAGVLNPFRPRTTYSDLIRPRGNFNVPAIVIAVPIFDSQRTLVGYLAGTVDLEEIQRLSGYSKVGDQGEVVVVDRQGRVIAHPNSDWWVEARDASGEGVFQQSLGQETGVSRYTDLEGNVPRVAGFATVPLVAWKVWVSQPVAELQAAFSHLVLYSLLPWLVVAVVMALVLAFVAAIWLARPVTELSAVAHRFAAGEFGQRARIPRHLAAREHIELADAFNQMATQLSAAYQTLEGKVRQRTSELQAANQELGRANQLKSQFLANISHELRTPLSAIIGFSEILLDGVDGPLTTEQKDDVAQVHKSGQSLLALINQILDLSKIEAGKMDLTVERVNLPAVINAVVESLRPLAQEKGLPIELDLPDELPALQVDSFRLKQILTNLLSNAIKFTSKGQIDVRAQPAGRMVRISVHDTGVGITPQAQKVIFDEFVQGDGSTTRRHGGTGLGLSIVRRLVEMHGGAIAVVSEPGMGSTFSFTMPVFTTPSVTEPEPRRATGRPAQGIGGTAILVVDDDASVRHLIVRHLEQEGWKTVQAANAADALTLARSARPVMITLDILLPDASGWWVLEELKADPTTAGIPVVVVSIVEDNRLVFSLGASDYLPKPFDRNDLLLKVHRLLPDLKARRLFVVDDDPAVCSMLAKMLTEEGADVTTLGDGEQALTAISQAPPDLVLLDLMMPGMSGFEVVARMRANPTTATVPVVIVSAKELTHEDALTLDGNIQRFVAKGKLGREGLIAALRQVLGQRAVAGDVEGKAA